MSEKQAIRNLLYGSLPYRNGIDPPIVPVIASEVYGCIDCIAIQRAQIAISTIIRESYLPQYKRIYRIKEGNHYKRLSTHPGYEQQDQTMTVNALSRHLSKFLATTTANNRSSSILDYHTKAYYDIARLTAK